MRAISACPTQITVEVIVVGLPNEQPADGPWSFRPTTRTPLGESGFSVRRRLPFLSDLVDPLQEYEAFDLGIVTNADIELEADFYENVARAWELDPSPLSVTRMTHVAAEDEIGNVAGPAQVHEHPGHDCLIAAFANWKRATPGDVVLGVPGVMKALLWSLPDGSRPVRVLHASGWTVHHGDDRNWADTTVRDYAEYNRAALKLVAADLLKERGVEVAKVSPSIRPYLDMSADRDTMVFSLNPGRSGSESLARLLANSAQIASGHEREPMMIGPWLRMVGFEGQAETMRHRRVKARAIEAEIELMRSGVYADTSHMFLYTFADVVLDHFADKDLVVIRLHRDPLEVARSFIELGYFSHNSRLGMDWHFWPTWPQSLITMPTGAVTGEWDLVFGSLIDFYRRQSRFISEHRDQVRVVPLRTRDLSDPAWQDTVAGAIGLESFDAGVMDRTQIHANRKEHERVRAVSSAHVYDEFDSFCRRFAIEAEELTHLGWGGSL